MDEFDPLPDWALGDCAAWQRVIAALSGRGLHLEVLESWRLDDGDRTRGDTMMCLGVCNDDEEIGTIIVRGRGRAGCDLWLGCQVNIALTDQVRDWARAISTAGERWPDTNSVP